MPRSPRQDADDEGFDRLIDYAERSTLIVLGLTVAGLAGFLSQVWGAAGVPFRTELAGLLKRSGDLFTLAWGLPVLRHLADSSIKSGRWRSLAYMGLWLILALFVFVPFGYLIREAADTILRFAKLPTP